MPHRTAIAPAAITATRSTTSGAASATAPNAIAATARAVGGTRSAIRRTRGPERPGRGWVPHRGRRGRHEQRPRAHHPTPHRERVQPRVQHRPHGRIAGDHVRRDRRDERGQPGDGRDRRADAHHRRAARPADPGRPPGPLRATPPDDSPPAAAPPATRRPRPARRAIRRPSPRRLSTRRPNPLAPPGAARTRSVARLAARAHEHGCRTGQQRDGERDPGQPLHVFGGLHQREGRAVRGVGQGHADGVRDARGEVGAEPVQRLGHQEPGVDDGQRHGAGVGVEGGAVEVADRAAHDRAEGRAAHDALSRAQHQGPDGDQVGLGGDHRIRQPPRDLRAHRLGVQGLLGPGGEAIGVEHLARRERGDHAHHERDRRQHRQSPGDRAPHPRGRYAVSAHVFRNAVTIRSCSVGRAGARIRGCTEKPPRSVSLSGRPPRGTSRSRRSRARNMAW